jgi:hypothetical protein
MITVRKIAACMMAGAIILSGNTVTARAAETPIAGIDISLSGIFVTPLTADLSISLLSLPNKKKEESNLAFAKVDDYVNIRNTPSEDGTILGKLYKNSVATILDKEGFPHGGGMGRIDGQPHIHHIENGE